MLQYFSQLETFGLAIYFTSIKKIKNTSSILPYLKLFGIQQYFPFFHQKRVRENTHKKKDFF